MYLTEDIESLALASHFVTRLVTIPSRDEHEGWAHITVRIAWVCPTCGGPRGEVVDTISWDGSRRLYCHGWTNPCGHVDKYSAVRKEAAANGLNGNPGEVE